MTLQRVYIKIVDASAASYGWIAVNNLRFFVAESSCSDGLQNQGETGVDCGGPCDPCVPSGYTDQGAGCCESGDFAANSIYSGSSNGLDDCAAKCDANQACGYVSYGWAGSTWCGLLKA